MDEEYVLSSEDRKFRKFVPPTGPFPKVSVTRALRDTMIVSLRHEVAHSGWRIMRQRAASLVIDRIAEVGFRFEMRCTELAETLGLSKSMGSYYLRCLREVGFLKHYRKHYMDWEKTERLRELLERDDVFCAAPAVHELCRSEASFKPGLSDQNDQGSKDEKSLATRGDPPGGTS